MISQNKFQTNTSPYNPNINKNQPLKAYSYQIDKRNGQSIYNNATQNNQLYKNNYNDLPMIKKTDSFKNSPNNNNKVPLFFRQSVQQSNLRRQQSYSANQDLNQIDVKQNIHGAINKILGKNTTCNLCYVQYPSEPLISLSNCEHQFCMNCLQQYVTLKTNMTEQVICPQQNCNQIMDQKSKFYQDLPQKLKEKYQTSKLWRQNVNNPNVRLCPRQQCKDGLIDLLKIPPQCRKCGKTYCKNCQLQSHQGSCQQNFQDAFAEWKRCPSCKLFIQRSEGCNHMTCRCGKQFCFICLSDWQQSHYSCGQSDMNQTQRTACGGIALCCCCCCGAIFFPIIALIAIILFLLIIIISIPFGLIALLVYSLCMGCPDNQTKRKFIVWPIYLIQRCLRPL